NPRPEGEGFSALDRHFARFIARISGDGRREIFLAAALVSGSTSAGNICLDLKALAGLPGAGVEAYPPTDRWLAILAENNALGRPGDYRPLILDDKGRLYLYRYWDYETKLADFVRARAKKGSEGAWPEERLALIREKLALLFPPEAGDDGQKLAALTALLKSFTVISGSPGTGKTTTVTKIMALLVELSTDKKLSIALAAPTGKAAVRLQEAVKKTKEFLPCSEATKAAIPETATTIHRLLGNVPDSPYFRYDGENPLSLDAVIVDEASMVDLPLLSKLVQALPPQAKLILLGDKDQLTSVEAGAVLGDICGFGSPDFFSEDFIGKIKFITGDDWEGKMLPGGNALHDCLVQLKRNYRFGIESGIGRLSAAVNAGDAGAAVSLLKSGGRDLCWREPSEERFLGDLKLRVVEGYRDYLLALSRGDQEEIFDLFEGFRILCALRHGPWGVEA
ncbi:MAG: exodeoxyribonuclease V subunit alpha, partial [Syntrophales bacterium LBB04]|nr:exodeoxyribonuclease V subunit alpha [Syntrophales bacterium LBB04]